MNGISITGHQLPLFLPSPYLGPQRKATQGNNMTLGPRIPSSCSHVTEQPESTNSWRGDCSLSPKYYRKMIKGWNNLMKNPFSYVTPFEPKLVISEIQISILKGLLSLPLMNESRNLINKMKRIPRPFFFLLFLVTFCSYSKLS